jgi:hypothetical protein
MAHHRMSVQDWLQPINFGCRMSASAESSLMEALEEPEERLA